MPYFQDAILDFLKNWYQTIFWGAESKNEVKNKQFPMGKDF